MYFDMLPELTHKLFTTMSKSPLHKTQQTKESSGMMFQNSISVRIIPRKSSSVLTPVHVVKQYSTKNTDKQQLENCRLGIVVKTSDSWSGDPGSLTYEVIFWKLFKYENNSLSFLYKYILNVTKFNDIG